MEKKILRSMMVTERSGEMKAGVRHCSGLNRNKVVDKKNHSFSSNLYYYYCCCIKFVPLCTHSWNCTKIEYESRATQVIVRSHKVNLPYLNYSSKKRERLPDNMNTGAFVE